MDYHCVYEAMHNQTMILKLPTLHHYTSIKILFTLCNWWYIINLRIIVKTCKQSIFYEI